MKKKFFIPACILTAVAMIFIIYILRHPEMQFPWDIKYCHSDNLASISVIEKCGGILIDIVEESSGVTNHYYEIRERS